MKRILAIIGILALMGGIAATARADIYDQRADIHSGTIDGTVIGGTAPSTGTFTDGYFYASGVAHGMTSIAPTTNYGAAFAVSSSLGGLDFYGLTDADQNGALRLTGIIGATNPTDSYAATILRGGKKNGTGWQALGAAETVLEFYNYTTSIGKAYGNGEWILTSLQNTPIGSTIASTGTFTTLSGLTPEVDGHTDATGLTARNCSGTLINSYGRTGAATLTLPTAATGLNFIAIVGTQHNSAWKIQRAGADTLIVDGNTGKTYIQETNQAVGSRIACQTFQTGATAWTWVCTTVSGTWVTD